MTLVTTKTVLPGKPGTLKELEKYDDQLVCVRYKYDPEKQRKIKTVEIIVDSKTIKSNNKRIPFNKKVFVRIDYHEKSLRRSLKSVGASWHPQKKLWELQYGDAYNLGLEDRIVEE